MFPGNTFLIKERVAALRLTDRYEIYAAETGQQLGLAKEEPPGWATFLRLVLNKALMPTTVNIYNNAEATGTPLFFIKRGVQLFRAKVTVHQQDGTPVGYFKSKISWGGGFRVYDMQDNQIADVKGDWKGWNFKFLTPQGQEVGTVTKKWAGIGKELFTSADNYVINISDEMSHDVNKMLLLAAGLAIDIVFKEKQ